MGAWCWVRMVVVGVVVRVGAKQRNNGESSAEMGLIFCAEDITTFDFPNLDCLSCNTLRLGLRGSYVWVVYLVVVCTQPVSVEVRLYVEAWASGTEGVCST